VTVIDALRERGLAYDDAERAGATLHLLGALRGFGKLGVTAIGRSPHEADDLYRRVVATVDELAADR
jgi:hypothetical protein